MSRCEEVAVYYVSPITGKGVSLCRLHYAEWDRTGKLDAHWGVKPDVEGNLCEAGA